MLTIKAALAGALVYSAAATVALAEPKTNLLSQWSEGSDAAAIAKKLLADAPDDADNLNSAAYLLAEADSDLPLAEESSRKSLQMLDAATAQSDCYPAITFRWAWSEP